jgi:hypothetical protein
MPRRLLSCPSGSIRLQFRHGHMPRGLNTGHNLDGCTRRSTPYTGGHADQASTDCSPAPRVHIQRARRRVPEHARPAARVRHEDHARAHWRRPAVGPATLTHRLSTHAEQLRRGSVSAARSAGREREGAHPAGRPGRVDVQATLGPERGRQAGRRRRPGVPGV